MINQRRCSPPLEEYEVRKIAEGKRNIEASQVENSEPEPLRRPLPPAEPYPMEALGLILGEAAKAIHGAVGAPAALVGQSLLAAASLAAQHLADVEIDGRREPISLWCMTVAESGERKSAVDKQVLRPHRKHEEDAIKVYNNEKREYLQERMAYEIAARSSSRGKGHKTIETVRGNLQGLGSPPETPLQPLLLISSPTIEGIHKQFISGLPSLGLFNDDAGDFLGGHSMSSENRTKTAAGLSRLWDSGEFDRVRAGDGAEKHFGKRLALHLMLQPVIAETVLSDEVLTGQGFLARCLMCWPQSTIGTRLYVESNVAADRHVMKFWHSITLLLNAKPTLREGTRNELQPRLIRLSAGAKIDWREFHDATEKGMGHGGQWSSIRAWASKAPAQVIRVAAVLALISNSDAKEIDKKYLANAVELVTHSLREVVRIVGVASIPPAIRNAQRLLEWCHQESIEYLHSNLAQQRGPNSIRTNQVFKAAMDEFVKAGWAHKIEGGMTIEGSHRRNVWKIVGKSSTS